jgi:hypothetical protein
VVTPVTPAFRTLATDKGFKERVREDMLVRLLDAFVWRNHGKIVMLLRISLYPNISPQIGKKNNNLISRTFRE